MARFIYEAKKDSKEVIQDVVIADSRSAAIQKMSKTGYFILSMREEESIEKTDSGGITISFNRIQLKDVTDFTRQFSDLLESGLTIVKALDILASQTENKKLKSVITDIHDFCTSGHSLSSALARHPAVFSELYVSMVRSGETGGALENILRRLADFNEKQLDIQTKVRTALAYPILMSLIGTATIIVLLTFVMPKVMVMFGDLGQALPLPTQILLNVSYAIVHFWWLIIVGFIVIGIGLVKMYRSKDGRLAVDTFRLKTPYFGKLIKKIEIARFTRTLATLLNNGVPILESLHVVAETMHNALMRQEMEKTYASVKEGSSLAKGLRDSKVIPAAVINMIAIGEESGRLEKSLFKIAEASERDSDEAIKVLMSLLEPVLILTLGLIVGFIVISMLLPIFEVNFLAQ